MPRGWVRWLAILAGAIWALGVLLYPLWYTNQDIMDVGALYLLAPGAWLSAACVVLVLGPRSPSTAS